MEIEHKEAIVPARPTYGLGENTEDPGSKLVTSTSVADGLM